MLYGNGCRKTGCKVFIATYIVTSDPERYSDLTTYWVCGRHIAWAMERVGSPIDNYEVTVKMNAWHKKAVQ